MKDAQNRTSSVDFAHAETDCVDRSIIALNFKVEAVPSILADGVGNRR